jgi:hypothetical protein
MKYSNLIIAFLAMSFPVLSSADQGLGGVAGNLLEPVSILSNFISTSSLVIGISFVFASIMKYFQHRANSVAVTLSSVVLLFVMGVLLILLPLAYKLTTSGIPYY